MKKITVLLSLAIAIISACMFYLVWKGISLRTAPLIKPTEISADHRNIADHVSLRLFPELQANHYVLWGVLPESPESQKVLQWAAEDYEKTFHTPVQIIPNGETASTAEIQACGKPCWILLPQAMANELTENSWITEKIKPTGQPYFNLTWISFQGVQEISKECDQQQRLHLDCLGPVAIREVKKKMKDPNKLYFFLRKYNDHDYFLFVQQK